MFNFSDTLNYLSKEDLKLEIEKSLKSNLSSHILCYSNPDAQKVNFWIKNSILKNGNDFTNGDLVVFGNNIRVEDENDPFAEPKKIYNGQFGTVIEVSEPITIRDKLLVPLTFRKTTIQLQESNHILTFLSLENFTLSDRGELSKDEIISFKILLYQLAEQELENFNSGKFHTDEELKGLLDKYNKKKDSDSKRKGITKIIKTIQRHLGNAPSTDYYKFKNAAQLRFGWALTVQKAMSYKWNKVFFNVETGGGKTNETYFKWIYTGIIRATQKVNLINYEPISPFCKIEVKPALPIQSNEKDFFYIADTTDDFSNQNREISERFKFPDSEIKSSLLQLFQVIESKISKQKLNINSINHPNYQEIYEIKGNNGELATASIYYNKKGQFNMPSLMKSQPREFGDELLNLLKSESKVVDFSFIKDNWRMLAYQELNNKLNSINFSIGYIIQALYKDTIQLNKFGNTLIVDMYYDGDGFFSTISVSSCIELKLWTEFQEIINELKEN
ncbi:hypothetical protein EZS27_029584 [termite gut metagenome]|uniref:TATA-binding-like protein domain-containing protein n=1 Tax=termite gut metagenome TaxID=433724 RepID=A0A5J4QII6_9ZZZZ